MLDHKRRLLLAVMLFISANWQSASADIPSADLPLEARDDSGSQEEDLFSTSYVLPNQIFNDGKPYYAGKDPISGQLDFSAKKPAGIETAANEVVDPKEKIVLNSSSPNIHDFLNLPVKYSSSKFVYPLVSSSYANLKYQGSNKNYVTNKKPTSVMAPVTPTPNSQNYYTIPTTKLMAVLPTAPGIVGSSTSITTTTSKKPTTAPTTTTSTISSSSKFTTSTRKPTLPTTTPPRLSVSTTRKKFIPTKKLTPTTAIPTASTPMRFPDQRPLNTTAAPSPITTTAFTIRHPTPHYPSTSTSSTSTTNKFHSSTSEPVVFTQGPATTPTFSPIPLSTHVPNLDAADVYQTLEHKNTEQKFEQKPSMTLADIFNSLAEEESVIASNNQGNQGFDAQGNLQQPIAPSRPSPFAMQGPPQPPRPLTTRPTFTSTTIPIAGQVSPLPHHAQDQKVNSGGQESFSNEYVSYQVQQPNVMQYRPAINNVVISPGQNSASFVLGSQQQVGGNAFGTVEKEPLFGKEPPVQYGTVINEDISSLQRPGSFSPAPSTSYQQVPPGGNSNFHQNGNFGHAHVDPTVQFTQRPTTVGIYQEGPPAPPSPYQQLPLIGSNMRPKPQPTMEQNVNAEGLQPPQATSAYPHGPRPTALPQTGFPQNTQEAALEHNNRPTTGALANTQDTKELLVSTNIRFPANDDQSEELSSAPVAAGPPAGPQVNGHAQPLSLQQIQNSNPVVFPKSQDEENKVNELQIHADDVQIQKHEVLTMNQHKQKLSFPQLSEHITPSQHMEPPPRYPTAEHAEIQKRPQATRPHGHPPHNPAFAYNEYTRKPVPGIQRPNPDRHLPNILPQFRPNAKVSSGHPPPTYNQEPGNIRLTGQPPLKRPNSAPQFAHRRQPLMQQKRFPMNRISEYPTGPPPPSHSADANRRVYRLPPYGGQGVQYGDRMYARRPAMPHALRPAGDGFTAERHGAAATIAETYQTLPSQQSAMSPERLAAFEEEDLVINDPPQPVTPSKDPQNIDEAKLEPVVTLQMLQSQQKPVTLPGEDTGSGEIQVPSASEHSENTGTQNGLYVVYPMGGNKQGLSETTDTTDSKDAEPAAAHIESPPSGSEYQNTPFSVVRDQPQEPILKNKKPQSLQQQAKAQAPKDKFPYPIEKPNPSHTEVNPRERVPGVLIAPRIINGAYRPGGTEAAPIAIAYTPTEPNPFRHVHPNAQKFSNVNLATSVINEIRADTQTEEGLNNDFDLRGQNFEKNFMAPFYPSVSLGTATSAPSNGWSILPSSTDSSIYAKNKINRADVVEASADMAKATTKVFELDSFQPELQGGFKPIYPPGYKIDDEEADEHMQSHENNKMPIALASRMEPPMSSSTSSPASSSTSTTSTPRPISSTTRTASSSATTTPPAAISSTTSKPPGTPSPTPRKKSAFETSLEALLFGDDEDFGDEARQKQSKAMSGPRTVTVPRMGPRSLKMS